MGGKQASYDMLACQLAVLLTNLKTFAGKELSSGQLHAGN